MGLIFPEYLTNWTMEKIREMGVRVLPNLGVKTMTETADAVTLTLSDNSQHVFDLVILSVGVEPNMDFTKNSGLESDALRGGIVVNSEMEARKDVYVCLLYDDLMISNVDRLRETYAPSTIRSWVDDAWSTTTMLLFLGALQALIWRQRRTLLPNIININPCSGLILGNYLS